VRLAGLTMSQDLLHPLGHLAAVLGFWGATEQKTGLSRAPHLPHVEAVLVKR
jgi:hypothetical protein